MSKSGKVWPHRLEMPRGSDESNLATVDVANLRIVPSDVAVLELSLQDKRGVWKPLTALWFPRASLPAWVGSRAPNDALFAKACVVSTADGDGERFDFEAEGGEGGDQQQREAEEGPATSDAPGAAEAIAPPRPEFLNLQASNPGGHAEQTPIVSRWPTAALPGFHALFPAPGGGAAALGGGRPASQGRARSESTGSKAGGSASASKSPSKRKSNAGPPSKPTILLDFYREQGSVTSQMRLVAQEYSGRQDTLQRDLEGGKIKVNV